MPPTPACTMRARTSSVPSLASAAMMASTEPCTSPLMTKRELLDAGRLELGHHLLEAAALAGDRQPLAPLALAVVGDLARARLVLHDSELVAGFRRGIEAQHLDRHRGPGSLRACSPRSSISARTRPQAEPATMMSPSFSVPRWTSAVPTGPRPRSSFASTITPSAARSGIGLELQHLGLQHDRFEQLVETGLLQRRNLDLQRVAAHAFHHDLVAEQLGAHALRIGARLVDLVDGDDDRHLGGLGVVDRLDRLRLHAVVGGHHQNDDVGDLGAAGAHGGERLVARRVDEGDLLTRRQL